MFFEPSTLIGSFGVGLLLIAYFLSLFGFISQNKLPYILLNLLGSGLSCYASFLIKYMPFVVLEGLWCMVAVIALIRKFSAKSSASNSRS